MAPPSGFENRDPLDRNGLEVLNHIKFFIAAWTDRLWLWWIHGEDDYVVDHFHWNVSRCRCVLLLTSPKEVLLVQENHGCSQRVDASITGNTSRCPWWILKIRRHEWANLNYRLSHSEIKKSDRLTLYDSTRILAMLGGITIVDKLAPHIESLTSQARS